MFPLSGVDKCVSAKSGKPFKCKGKLANLEYNGAKYVGFDRTGWA